MGAKKRKASLGSIMMRIACTLFCLVLISTSMMSGLYAKYTARGEGSDSARVAEFTVEGQLSPNDVTVDIGNAQTEGEFTLTTSNTSEVAVRYDVVLEATVPAGITVSLDGVAGSLVGGKYTFTDVDQLVANSDTGSHIIKFAVTDLNAFTAPATDNTYTSEIDFKVTVKFVQID